METFVHSILSALFFPPRDIANKAAFVSGFLEQTRVFDGDPMILPMGNAPPPVPRIVMKSRDERYACEIALEHLHFTYNDTRQQRRTLDSLYPEYRDVLHRVVVAALAGIGAPVMRLGFVTRHVIEPGESANEWMRQNYLQGDRIPAAFETHLHLLQRFEMETFRVNRWIKLWTLRDPQQPEKDPAAMMEVDVNTIPEPGAQFDRSAIVDFYLNAFDQTEKDVRQFLVCREGTDG